MASTEPMSMRLSPELKAQFQDAARNSGLKQEDFITTLLATYSEREQEGVTIVSQEKKQIRAGLNQIQTLVEAVIDRAENQEAQATETVDKAAQEYTAQAEHLKIQIAALNDTVKELETENIRLKEEQESRESLKQGFEERQEAWKTSKHIFEGKIAEMTEKLASVSDENIAFRKEVDVLKTNWQEIQDKYETAKTEYQLTLKDLELDCQNRIHGLETDLAKKYESRIAACRQEHDNKFASAIEKERTAADKRFAELQEQLALAREKTDQLRVDYEEKIKAAVESERVTGDHRLKEIIKALSPTSEKPEDGQ